MRKRLMVLILVLGVLFAPGFAFADDFGGSDGGDFSDKVVYGPVAVDVLARKFGVQVYSGNKFNAALTSLGYDPYSSVFTDDVKAFLSNDSTGGSFIDFANTFTVDDLTYIGADPLGNTWSAALLLNNSMYGKDNIWCSVYSETLFNAAKARVQEVLDGNISGGSGGGSDANDVLEYTAYRWNSNSDGIVIGGNRYYVNKAPLTPDTYKVQINDNLKQKLQQLDGYKIVSQIDGYYPRIWFFFVKDGDYTLEYSSVNWSGGVNTVPVRIRSGSTIYMAVTASNNSLQLPVGQFNMPSDLTFTLTSYGTSVNMSNITYFSDGATSAPVVPPTQWPEPDPVTPTEPPYVPGPPVPTTPTEPTITVPTIPTLPPLTYPTEPTYATPDIAAILDAMAKHCKHLQECMKNVSDDYYDSMTAYMLTLQNKDFEFFRSWFRVTLDTIRDCFDDLSDYLHSLFTWLADQMDFTFTGGDFDDSSIVWWLKQIYSKLGSGTTVKPTDPVVDPTGAGDWLDQLLKNFILDLLALGQDALADVAEMFRQLITKFPFSIPWDIAAMLALFSATPQIPVIQIPQYALTGSGISQVGTYTIDLTPYDGVMGIARSVENVVFAFWLAWKIDFFKAILTGVLGGEK